MNYKWCPNNVTINKKNEDTWEILWMGKKVDEVFIGWTRNGGKGYTYIDSVFTYKTLREAVINCYRKKHQM